MIDWGDEVKPRPHSGRVGIDRVLKDARRGDLQAVRRHLRRDPSLLLAKSGGHNRTFLWEATRGNRPALVQHLMVIGNQKGPTSASKTDPPWFRGTLVRADVGGPPETLLLLLAGWVVTVRSPGETESGSAGTQPDEG